MILTRSTPPVTLPSMSEKAKEKPGLTQAAKRAAQAREERQAAALRANLLRRKAQARDRADSPPPEKKP